MLHENDPCCYYGKGRHAEIEKYDNDVTAALRALPEHGGFTTVISDWAEHEVCPRDRRILSAALARATGSTDPDFSGLPCDILRGGEVPCPDPGPAPPPGPVPHVSGCWRGAVPPCVYAASNCTPSASTRWRAVDAGNGTVRIEGGAAQCLTIAGAPASHAQLTLRACAPGAAASQLWRLASGGAIRPASAASYCVDVGLPLQPPASELQLYAPCAAPASNEEFSFRADGTLRAGVGACVAACAAGEPMCGTNPEAR